MKYGISALTLLFGVTLCAFPQTKRAFVLGIDTYQPAGTKAQHDANCAYGRCELGSFDNLEGAVNDAQSIADVLTGPKFGFPAGNVVLLTNPAPAKARPGVVVLPADQTTRDGILAAMKKYLVDTPQRGDTVVFYDASHGSLRVNTAGEKLTVRDEEGKLVHVDSTLVPADVYKGGYDIRDREMTRLFNAALDKGIQLTVIFDSCHSGGSTRGLGAHRQRSLPYDPRPVNDPPDLLPGGQRVLAPTQRVNNPALVFSAVQQDQEANEADPTPDNPEPHGAFTAALVETLQILPADAPASLVYQRVKAILEGSGFADQEPDLDANATRRSQPLFGGTSAADAGKVRTAALKVDDDGSVWLDIGTVSGVGPGSEFTALSTGAGGPPVKLTITKALGIARSSASVLPAGAKVRIGDVFELTKLLPAQTSPLRFYLGPTNLSAAQVGAAVAQVHAAGAIAASDPAEEPYTDVLSWDGKAWMLRHVAGDAGAVRSHSFFSFERKRTGPVNLGPEIAAAALRSHLAPNAKLWVDLPVSTQIAATLHLGDANSIAQTAPTPADASYVLAGSLVKGAPGYAWFHKNEFSAGPPHAAAAADHSPGCSTTSPYPVRSDWVPAADPASAAATLSNYSGRLAKLHGWLDLSNNAVADASAASFYSIALLPVSGAGTQAPANPIDSTGPVRETDRLRLALQAKAPVAPADARYVYILDINCHGTGQLVYPLDASENKYPGDGDTDAQVLLRHAPTLKVGPPFGVDTLVLLSTAQPLPDPGVLNFEGVARGATRGASSPLQQLLSSASSGTRGISAEVAVPTTWGIQTTSLRSVPKAAGQ